MTSIPTVAFTAHSGTGKTTLLEKIVRELKQRGLRVCAIKQDAHHIQLDREGKDSWRFAQAGADMVIVSGPEQTAVIERRARTLEQNLEAVHDVDIILVEGYCTGDVPKIGICRKATGLGFAQDLDCYAAIVTDDGDVQTDLPRFGLDDVEAIATFILERLPRAGVQPGRLHALQRAGPRQDGGRGRQGALPPHGDGRRARAGQPGDV